MVRTLSCRDLGVGREERVDLISDSHPHPSQALFRFAIAAVAVAVVRADYWAFRRVALCGAASALSCEDRTFEL